MIDLAEIGFSSYIVIFVLLAGWYGLANARRLTAIDRLRGSPPSSKATEARSIGALRTPSKDPQLEPLRARAWRRFVILTWWLFLGVLLPINFLLLGQVTSTVTGSPGVLGSAAAVGAVAAAGLAVAIRYAVTGQLESRAAFGVVIFAALLTVATALERIASR